MVRRCAVRARGRGGRGRAFGLGFACVLLGWLSLSAIGLAREDARDGAVDGGRTHSRGRHAPDGEVVDVSETNFDEVLARGTPVLLKVYAEWCKHCVALAPVWGEVARELEGELFVARANGPKNRLLVKRVGAKAYPTIVLFKGGKMYEYESGDRSVQALVAFARKDYRRMKSRAFYHAAWFSRVLRALYAVPACAEKAYAYLRQDLRMSNVAILFLTLLVPVTAGMFAIFIADMVIVRHVLQETRSMYRNDRGGARPPRRQHEHFD